MAIKKEDLNNSLKRQKSLEGKISKTVQVVKTTVNGETRTNRIETQFAAGSPSFKDDVIKSSEERLAKTATKLGGTAGEVLGGVQSLGVEKISPNEVMKNTGLAKLTDGMPNISGLKAPDTSGIASITGLTDASPASAVKAIGANGPAGIAKSTEIAKNKASATISDITSFTETIADAGELSTITASVPSLDFGDIKDTIKEITPISSLSGKLEDVKNKVEVSDGLFKNQLGKFSDVASVEKANGGFGNLTSGVTSLGNKIKSFSTDVLSKVDKGANGFLQNLGETIGGSAQEFIGNVLPNGIETNPDERKNIIQQINSGKPEEKVKAIRTVTSKSQNITSRMRTIVSNTSAKNELELSTKVQRTAEQQGIPANEISDTVDELGKSSNQLSQLDTTIGGTLVLPAGLFAESTPLNSAKWSGRNSPDDIFSYVSSVEELRAEFSNITRGVTEVVIHATESFTNANYGAIEINNFHNKLGHDGIAYHYVIQRDGRLQRGRPVNRVGEHAPINNHNSFSIGVVLVGGLNTASTDETLELATTSKNFTREQYTTLEKFLQSFYNVYPGGQVFGHNDIDLEEDDPFFDVSDYIFSLFRKANKTRDTFTTPPLTPQGIAQRDYFTFPRSKGGITSKLPTSDLVAPATVSLLGADRVNLDSGEIAQFEESLGVEEELETNLFERPPKPEGYPRTDEFGVVTDKEWEETSSEWISVVDYSNYNPIETGETEPSQTVLYTNLFESEDISLDDI